MCVCGYFGPYVHHNGKWCNVLLCVDLLNYFREHLHKIHATSNFGISKSNVKTEQKKTILIQHS